MAKKITKIGITGNKTSTTAVRGSAIPKPATAPAPSKGQITHEMIAQRAYEIWQSGKGGSEYENWLRAERELRGL